MEAKDEHLMKVLLYKQSLESRNQLLAQRDKSIFKNLKQNQDHIRLKRNLNTEKLRRKEDKERRELIQQFQLKHKKELNMTHKFNSTKLLNFNQQVIKEQNHQEFQAIKQIVREGHQTIKEIDDNFKLIKQKKKEQVKTLEKTWSNNLKQYWVQRLQYFKRRRAEDQQLKRERIRLLSKDIYSLQMREKSLCDQLNRKLQKMRNLKTSQTLN